MMRSIQNSSNGLVMKLILGAIAASFALWGVGDMFRGGVSGGYALKAGDKEVSLQEYRDELTLRYGALRQVMGGNFTPELANRLGIGQQVMNDLQTGLLVQLEAESLGLKVPESEILKSMRNTAAFQMGGNFNKDSFQQALRQAGISEKRYIESLNKETLSKLLLQNFSSYVPDLTDTATLLYRLRNEKRDVTFYRFTQKVNVSELPTPDDRALEDYHKAYGEQFRKPEYRKLAWVTLSKDKIAKGLSIDDETLMQLYDDKKDSLTTPERREVSQLLYETEETAQNALALLRQGQSFAEVIQEHAPENEMLSLGVITSDGLPEAARGAVLALKASESTSPIETDFGWHIFRVENIIEQTVPSFESVRDDLSKEWFAAELEDAIYDVTVEIEDSLAANIPLEETTKELGLTTQSSEWVNANGLNLEGKKVALPKQPSSLLSAGFKLQDETDSSLIDNGTGDYVLVAMEDLKGSYIPVVSDLDDTVKKAWTAKQLRDAQREKSMTLAAAVIKDSSKLKSDLFRPLKGKNVQRSGDLPNAVSNAFTELPPGLRQDIFTKPVSGITDAYLVDSKKGTYVLAKVNRIASLSDDAAGNGSAKAEIEKIVAELNKQYGEDVLSLYLQHLARKYPVDINERAIAQLSTR
ncbi:MAG: SurA N-terminal domain-containing protein [Rickettsiales bacterium]|nr:SurA N-terminal domain-containing protein [Rickettsiales bacterium]